jgi:subtilase family serine protease
MNKHICAALVLPLVLVVAACGQRMETALPALPALDRSAVADRVGEVGLPADVRESCPGPAPAGIPRCVALVRMDAATPSVAGGPAGLSPADLQSAYALPSSTRGSGQTVAIVDAYDDPHAEADLGVYRAQFGLPPCTTANGCFRKLNQAGQRGAYPAPNAGWAEEVSLDLDMVSAICPNCKIMLVEASAPTFASLGAAVDTAARLHANAISNSYGSREYPSEVNDQSHYDHRGIMITASSGDNGYGPQFPAASLFVTAVGGTSLYRSSAARGWTETAWSGAGSGCSAYVTKPGWQHDLGCPRRTIADVAADADPYTGVAVYDRGWMVFGGTSVSAPIIASVYALAGNAGTSFYGKDSYLQPAALFDVTSGTNGSCMKYLCMARVGYDGPTGNGTPNGVAGF